MLKAESTIGIILVLIFGMSLGFISSQTFILNHQNDLKQTQDELTKVQNKHIQSLSENLELKEKLIEFKNKQ